MTKKGDFPQLYELFKEGKVRMPGKEEEPSSPPEPSREKKSPRGLVTPVSGLKGAPFYKADTREVGEKIIFLKYNTAIFVFFQSKRATPPLIVSLHYLLNRL